MKKLKVIVVGCGNMGSSHARAYHKLDEFELCGIVARREETVDAFNKSVSGNYKCFLDIDTAIKETAPDAVAICTYPDTHEALAIKAIEAGCHVFLEKPISSTVEGALRVAECAKKHNKKVVVGYILRHHPSWIKFIDVAQGLGKPLVMRMNLNQQSSGKAWGVHKNLLNALTPIVDCGVHYIDVMCQMTKSRPTRVSGISARLSSEIGDDKRNYGQLQVEFEDGSIGWYEAGWGPMMSTNAFFVKDVIGPKGCASICADKASSDKQSDNIDAHTKTEKIRLHYSALSPEGEFGKEDEWIDNADEPTHDELCAREQLYLYDAIVNDKDLSQHIEDAINSLAIALAADESARTGKMIYLNK